MATESLKESISIPLTSFRPLAPVGEVQCRLPGAVEVMVRKSKKMEVW